MKQYLFVLLFVSTTVYSLGYEKAFQKTPAGKVEIKTIPSSTKLTTSTDGEYFDNSNKLFLRLFDYIKENKIKMTVPVEGGLDKSTMSFYLGDTAKKELLKNSKGVIVTKTEEYTVASIGARGSYSAKNIRASEQKLLDWLNKHKEYSQTGSPYAIFWNSPFMIGFLKRYEIHIPVIKKDEEESVVEMKEDEMKKLEIGNKAPSFELQDQNGNIVKLSDFNDRKLLVYFYPKANTPGCTKQSCSVSESLPDLKSAGVEAVGISPDTPAAQKRFDEKYQLGFPLLADTEHTTAKAYGVWDKKTLYGKIHLGIIRSAFLINEQGVLEGVWYKVSPEDTVPNAKSAIGKL